jgi:hypothetical protein
MMQIPGPNRTRIRRIPENRKRTPPLVRMRAVCGPGDAGEQVNHGDDAGRGLDARPWFRHIDMRAQAELLSALRTDTPPSAADAPERLSPSARECAPLMYWVTVCFIEELHRRHVQAGESSGAAYVVGWFDDVPAMERVYDRYKGARSVVIADGKFRLE